MKSARLCGLTIQELSKLPSNTNVYKSVGKMFLLSDLNTVSVELEDKKKDAEKQFKILETSVQRLEKEVDESQKSLGEFMKKISISD